jgi:hypothetical protein
MTLRIQKERMEQGQVPEGEAFFKEWGLTPERLALADKNAIVMHPGPMNRGIEIAMMKWQMDLSLSFFKQVTFGIAVQNGRYVHSSWQLRLEKMLESWPSKHSKLFKLTRLISLSIVTTYIFSHFGLS